MVPKSYHSLPTSPPNHQDPQIDTLDEVDKRKYKKNNKIPSVKIRLFRKNSGAKRKSTMEFDANDFDVPMPKASRPKKVAFNPRISRSDWDIYDSKGGSDMREELEMLLSRNSKDLSIRSKSPEVEEDFKSQYFDALETLSEDEEEDVPSSIVDEKETNEDIVESVAENTFDPLPGRYLMASSENFDDFMKILGVGMIKRKLANSVIPVNEIEIAEDGQYTIRTVTTVRTTEINFKLDEPFIEDTIDGRKTQTIPTRTGNFLKLDQKGDKSKGEKDSVMTRDLVGDVITMKLIVDNVVCTRIYKRIDEKGDFITIEVPKIIEKKMSKNKASVKGPSCKPSEMENNTNEDEYEDIESDLENDETEKSKNKRRRKRMDLKSQPLQVQRNVKALKRLLYQQKKMESDMYKDIHKLEGYFYKIHQSKIYNERLKQVEGVLNQSTIIEEDENDEDNPSTEMQEPGIPGFWLRVLLNSKNLSQIVQVRVGKLLLFNLYFINFVFFQSRQQIFLFLLI